MKRTILLSALALTLLAPLPAQAADVSVNYQSGSQTLLVDLPAGSVPSLVESDHPARLVVTIPHGAPAHAESLTYARGLVSRLVVAGQGAATVVTLELRAPLHAAYRLDLHGDQLEISLTGALVAPPSLPPRPLPSRSPSPHPSKKPVLPKPPVLKATPKPTVKHSPKPAPKPTAKPTPKPIAKPSLKPVVKRTPTPTPSTMTLASPLPIPESSQSGVLQLGASPLPTPIATGAAIPLSTPRPTPMPMPSPSPSHKPTPTPKPKLTPKPSAAPTAQIRPVKAAAGNHVHVGELNYDEDTRFLMVPISGRVVPIYTSTTNPPQLIIDLPDATVGTTQKHTYPGALVSEAIAYQHTPTETRIILTFARPIGENWVMKQTPKNLILIFDRRPVNP